MNTTLVGVFDQPAQAQQARNKLEACGIDSRSIRVQGGTDDVPAEPAEDRRGFFAKLFGIGDDDDDSQHYGEAMRRGNTVVSVDVSDESRIAEVTDILEDCGAADVDERVEEWKSSGYMPSPATGRPMSDDAGQTLQSVEEQLKVGKRTVQKGRVRVHRSMTETPVEEQLTLHDEKAAIERKKVDRPATEADMQSAFKDKDIEVRETSEEPVVSKSARVVEEVTLGKKSSERTETVRDSVRSTRLDVSDTSDQPPSMKRAYAGTERRLSAGRGSYTGVERRTGL